MNLQWKVGDTTITKITEIAYPDFPDLIPAATPEVVKKVQVAISPLRDARG